MIKALKELFQSPGAAAESEPERQRRIQLAAAALLIETARADFTQSAEEQAAFEPLLCRALALPADEVRALVEQASAQVDESTSLYEFTRVINDHCDPQQKLELIGCMWAVAYADGDLDKYEEHLIRRVAELTYVPHEDYIRSKLAARNGA